MWLVWAARSDLSLTVVEAKYAKGGRGKTTFSSGSIFLALLFMRFEAVPSVRKLCLGVFAGSLKDPVCKGDMRV